MNLTGRTDEPDLGHAVHTDWTLSVRTTSQSVVVLNFHGMVPEILDRYEFKRGDVGSLKHNRRRDAMASQGNLCTAPSVRP